MMANLHSLTLVATRAMKWSGKNWHRSGLVECLRVFSFERGNAFGGNSARRSKLRYQCAIGSRFQEDVDRAQGILENARRVVPADGCGLKAECAVDFGERGIANDFAA
jgi:hypothetical protein